MGNSLERPFAVEYINPRVFVVNARDAEEVPLLAKPNRSAPEVGPTVWLQPSCRSSPSFTSYIKWCSSNIQGESCSTLLHSLAAR